MISLTISNMVTKLHKHQHFGDNNLNIIKFILFNIRLVYTGWTATLSHFGGKQAKQVERSRDQIALEKSSMSNWIFLF